MPELSGLTSLRSLKSERLNLVAATRQLIELDVSGSANLAASLGVTPPSSWPPELYGSQALAYAAAQTDHSIEHGWTHWYLTTHDDPRDLIGVCGFKGRPDGSGSVEIAYSILPGFWGKGFATEAVGSLVRWAFLHHNVTEVCAETMPHMRRSIRVLEKAGFHPGGAGSEHGVVRYAIQRERLK